MALQGLPLSSMVWHCGVLISTAPWAQPRWVESLAPPLPGFSCLLLIHPSETETYVLSLLLSKH